MVVCNARQTKDQQEQIDNRECHDICHEHQKERKLLSRGLHDWGVLTRDKSNVEKLRK